ncbi:nicotinate-nucleotide adenylyltransferase [Calothrix sp. NIES-3974]|uniref:nicotinate-nucleotide adenylyltransferase n=1 Tax=Calothrix sp. NIES-3974 TaxID=2005462 RepID=UPI000B61340A|nr:nicotinate-nucleotide adenylyltransferase [Calothrix sp. NIES-3974]BAZ05451.1 nicotinic acid mononucleotide adenyltransferase [Calothrix sp. NIES-3974]
MKIALFGTSADPPTAGHGDILQFLSEQFDLVIVWTAENPFKGEQTPLHHRVAMLDLLIQDIDIPKGNIELRQDLSRRRTLETLELAKQYWGTDKVEYHLVVGSDLLSQLPRWYRIEDLLRQVKLFVIPRPGYGIGRENLQKLETLGAQIAIANYTGKDVSSTRFREHGNIHALTPSVINYIHQQHLYKCQDYNPQEQTTNL